MLVDGFAMVATAWVRAGYALARLEIPNLPRALLGDRSVRLDIRHFAAVMTADRIAADLIEITRGRRRLDRFRAFFSDGEGLAARLTPEPARTGTRSTEFEILLRRRRCRPAVIETGRARAASFALARQISRRAGAGRATELQRRCLGASP